jgi:hypothetical protein
MKKEYKRIEHNSHIFAVYRKSTIEETNSFLKDTFGVEFDYCCNILFSTKLPRMRLTSLSSLSLASYTREVGWPNSIASSRMPNMGF